MVPFANFPTNADPNIDKERKKLHKEMARIRKFYKGTTDEDDEYVRFLAAHNKGLDLLMTGARRRLQARFDGMKLDEAMQCEMMHSVGTPLGMLHVMVWYTTAASDGEHELRRLYVWAYLRRYKLVRAGLGVLSGFSLKLSHQPLEDSQRQWDKAIQFFTWCEFEAPNFHIKDDPDDEEGIPMQEQKKEKPLAARLRGHRVLKPKKLGKLLKKRAH